jgi:hypothetical protein
MWLFLILLYCSVLWGQCGDRNILRDNSLCGNSNSRLRQRQFPIGLLREFAGNGLIRLTLLCKQTAIFGGNRRGSRFNGKTGNRPFLQELPIMKDRLSAHRHRPAAGSRPERVRKDEPELRSPHTISEPRMADLAVYRAPTLARCVGRRPAARQWYRLSVSRGWPFRRQPR